MKLKAILTTIESGVILKQLADWTRTVSAGALILGILNPAILGDHKLQQTAVLILGAPCLILCLIFSFTAAKLDTWTKQKD